MFNFRFYSPLLLGVELKRSRQTFHSSPSQNVNVGTSRDISFEMTDNNYALFFLSIVMLICLCSTALWNILGS